MKEEQYSTSESRPTKPIRQTESLFTTASLSPWQAKERERTITVTSGFTCSGPSMKSGPIGSLVRTLLASSRWYNPVRRLKWEVNPLYSERVTLYLKDGGNMSLRPSAVILNVKDIPSSRYLYRLVPSGLPTAATGYGLLPTVTAQDFKRRGANSRQQGLPELVNRTLFPTPLATEIHHPDRVKALRETETEAFHSRICGEIRPNSLIDFLDFYGMLPTPVASDAGVGTVIGKDDRIIITPKGKIRKINRKGQFWSVGLGRMAELLLTPRANLMNGCNLDNPVLANRNKGNLEEIIAKWIREEMIPTPTARDWKGAASPESLERRGRIPEKNSLPDFFARTGKGFQLNPLFVAEMMGFPPEWTVSPFLSEDNNPSKDTETPLSPR